MSDSEPDAPQSPEERRDRVMQIVLERGTISAREIADVFGVSVMTAHRDLDALARTGVVRRFHGGVSAQPGASFGANITFRERSRLTEKAEIAALAATFVEPGMSVLIEDSTTAFAVAEALVGIAPLTVITNFPRVVEVFADLDEIELLVLGGTYSRSHDAYLGLACIDALESVHADIHFSSTSGITANRAYQPDPTVVLLMRAMVAAAERSVLVLDHTKIGRTAVHSVGPLTMFDDVITDSGADPEKVRALREQHPNVQLSGENR
ncbi:DeoR/GlpR family DNA-binding transcription regulator [Ruania zhangjianzhongii]|uniref:DeoR/GlpR family DNA-binding transcription regulator n=1 Tax=Ruania zhangjianzhongii TaxID=2603206 RepID=UPI001AEF3F62|nr:DeoR/GlpR family DNA-binding transcription regulator [Ruania zhangjianzhongii]